MTLEQALRDKARSIEKQLGLEPAAIENLALDDLRRYCDSLVERRGPYGKKWALK